jgi:3-methylcrotonyl-CoA carboxylase alpha subunit
MRFAVTLGTETLAVEVEAHGGRQRVRLGEEWVDVNARWSASGSVSLLVDGAAYLADVGEADGEIVVSLGFHVYRMRVEEPGRRLGRRGGRDDGGSQRLVAPMPGRVVAVHVRSGDTVEAGAPLVVLEAMKMENEFRSTVAGRVAEVSVAPGQAVNAGDLLVVITPAD